MSPVPHQSHLRVEWSFPDSHNSTAPLLSHVSTLHENGVCTYVCMDDLTILDINIPTLLALHNLKLSGCCSMNECLSERFVPDPQRTAHCFSKKLIASYTLPVLSLSLSPHCSHAYSSLYAPSMSNMRTSAAGKMSSWFRRVASAQRVSARTSSSSGAGRGRKWALWEVQFGGDGGQRLGRVEHDGRHGARRRRAHERTHESVCRGDLFGEWAPRLALKHGEQKKWIS